VVVFDKPARRWIVAELAGIDVNNEPTSECIAVSETDDATGSYYRYGFDLGGNQIDYVKIGVWPDAYYFFNNNYDNSTGVFRYPQFCALDRTRMIVGLSATAQCFFPNGSYTYGLPSDLDGSNPPPSGSPNNFLTLDNGLSVLNLFRFHVDFNNSSNSTLTGPIQIPVQPYNSLPTASIPQPGVTDVLTKLSYAPIYRLAYRNFGDHESLVVNHTVDAGGGIAGIRWYEIRQPGSITPTVYQQGTYNPYAQHRWMGSMAMDAVGDIAL